VFSVCSGGAGVICGVAADRFALGSSKCSRYLSSLAARSLRSGRLPAVAGVRQQAASKKIIYKSKMKTIKVFENSEANILMNWCHQQTLESEIFTGRETCRTKKWWGFEAEFYFNRSHVESRQAIASDSYLAGLRDQFYPEADSILLYRYEIGGTIGEHLDKQCFNKSVTLINLVDADSDLFGNRPTTRFRWDKQNFELRHGEVVEFDSRVIHSVPKLKSARYSLQFRKIR